MGPPRNPFDQDEDALLTKYIAVYNPDKPGRLGNGLYRRLVENADNKWPWSHSHSWQSWRDRYKKNEYRFDAAIKKYQQKKKMKNLTDAGTNSEIDRNGAANGQPNGSDTRTKNESTFANGTSSTPQPRTSQPLATQHCSRKDNAVTSYLEAEEAGITSDEQNHDREKVDSQGRKHVARKTARKTAVFPGYSEDDEKDTADRVASGQYYAAQGKRKVSEDFDGDDGAKRRRIQDEVPKAVRDQKSLEISRSANGSSHHISVAEVGLHEPQHGASSSAFGQLSAAIIRSLNAVLALNGPKNLIDDKNNQRTVFDALQLTAEERKDAIEYAKAQLPGAAAPVESENAENQERLYPQLSEEDIGSAHGPNPKTPKAQNNSWPPPRNRKSTEDNVYPVAESTPTRRSSDKSPSKVQIAPTIITAPKIESSPPKPILKTSAKREETIRTVSPVKKENLAAVRRLLWPSTNGPKENDRDNRRVQANLRHISEPSPSAHYASAVQAPLVDNSDKVAIPAWWSEATLPRGKAPSVSSTTSSDPFLTASLRKQGKGKSKEVAFASARAKANRRETFGGFSTHGVPEFDLRTKALRSSLPGKRRASNIRRSPSSDSSKEEEHERSQDPSRRTSFTATVDLSRDLPVADVQLNPTDKARITSAGLQFFIKSMAQNHGMSEDWVLEIFKVSNDLKATDHILAQMEAAARRACMEAMERADGRKNAERTVGVTSTPKEPSLTGQANNTHKLSNSREIDLAALPSSQDRSVSRKRLSELQYTPGEEDPTFARLRDQYAPPSASRAARYIRTRARRSSGITSSPPNPNMEDSLRHNDEDSEKEEMEVTKALTPGRLLEGFSDSSAVARANRDGSPPLMNMMAGTHTSPETQRPWSADEDKILLDGEDGEAIDEITKRRGKLAVKGRIVELNNEDSIL